jgi:hypothetical protein
MGFFNKEYITMDNLTPDQLENILAYLDENDPHLFGLTGRKFIEVQARYSNYLGKMFFKLTVPRAWINRLSEATTLDMIKQGMVR